MCSLEKTTRKTELSGPVYYGCYFNRSQVRLFMHVREKLFLRFSHRDILQQ